MPKKMSKLIAWITHIAIHAGTAALWMSVGVIVTMIVQDNLQAAQTLLNITTASAVAVIAAALITWATLRAMRRQLPIEGPAQPREPHSP